MSESSVPLKIQDVRRRGMHVFAQGARLAACFVQSARQAFASKRHSLSGVEGEHGFRRVCNEGFVSRALEALKASA